MQEKRKPDFFCPVCQAGISEDDIREGAAIRRYHEVYCREHFREKFPDECENHPGTLVTAQCDQCGRWVCDDCLIDLAGEKVCQRCKPARIGEIITGQPATQVVRKRWKPLTMGKDAIRRVGAKLFRQRYKSEPVDQDGLLEKRPAPHEKRYELPGWQETQLDLPRQMLAAALYTMLIPFASVSVILTYLKYKPLFDRGILSGRRTALTAYYLAVTSVILWPIIICLIIILAGT